MYVHLNQDFVVLDATPSLLYVGKNPTTGKKIIVKKKSDNPIGVLGSKSVIRPLASSSLVVDFNTVVDCIPVASLPSGYVPNKFVYHTDGTFTEYEGVAPEDNKTLTVGVNENSDGIFDLADAVDENSLSIFDLAEQIGELEERVSELEG